MKKFLKWVVIIFVAILAITIFANRKEGGKVNAITTSSSTSPKGYVLKSNELALLNFMLKDDAEGFTKGRKSLLGVAMLSASAPEIERAYSENQVAADQKYYNKTIFLRGTVESINSGLGNEPYLVLNGTNLFMSPQVRFNEGSVEKIAALKKGQKLHLVCIGNGAIAGTPMFKNCQFAQEYADQKIPQIKSEILDFLSGSVPSFDHYYYQKMSVGIIAMARLLPESSTCFTDGSKCLIEMKAINEDVLEKKTVEVVNELRASGVQINS